MSICLIFWCKGRNLSVKNYSKMYSKMSLTLKSILEKKILGYYRLLLLSMFEFFQIITPVHPKTRGQPRKSCSDSAGHFLRSWIRPWISRYYYVLCKIALPARYTALAAITIPIRWYLLSKYRYKMTTHTNPAVSSRTVLSLPYRDHSWASARTDRVFFPVPELAKKGNSDKSIILPGWAWRLLKQNISHRH
jgi:hypothetical protein